MKKCIDVSAWQGEIKLDAWKKIKKAIPCVILRSSYTIQADFLMYKDKCFDANIQAAHGAKMQIGVYHYSQALNEAEAKAEAEFVIKTIKKYKEYISLPVAFDWEFGGRLNSYSAGKRGKQRCAHICDAFCRKIQSAGFTPMVYANLSTLNGYIADDIYKRWLIWVAQYNNRCDYKHPYYMWQYSSGGRVSGIDGRIDMNYIYGQDDVARPSRTEKYPYELPKLPTRGWFTSGDKGAEVMKLQRFLNWYGDYGLRVDGIVGGATMHEVLDYERQEELTPKDGLFGKKCLERAKTVKR